MPIVPIREKIKRRQFKRMAWRIRFVKKDIGTNLSQRKRRKKTRKSLEYALVWSMFLVLWSRACMVYEYVLWG